MLTIHKPLARHKYKNLRVHFLGRCYMTHQFSHRQEQGLPVLNSVTDFEKIKRVGEGTYGVVCKCGNAIYSFRTTSFPDLSFRLADKARNKKTGEIVALKKLRMDRERDGKLSAPCISCHHAPDVLWMQQWSGAW